MKALCYQCGPKGGKIRDPKQIKTVTMHVEDGPDGKKIITYLCGPCRKELGLCPPAATSAA